MKSTKQAAYIGWGPIITLSVISLLAALVIYTAWGTEEDAGFNVLRYEGYQRGSWSNHGGKVWYQVEEARNSNIRYHLYVTLWNGELHLYYHDAENVSNLQVKVEDSKR